MTRPERSAPALITSSSSPSHMALVAQKVAKDSTTRKLLEVPTYPYMQLTAEKLAKDGSLKESVKVADCTLEAEEEGRFMCKTWNALNTTQDYEKEYEAIASF